MLSSKLVSKLGVREAAAAPAKRFLWERAAALGVGIAPGRSALFGAHQDGLIAAKAELPEGDQDPNQEGPATEPRSAAGIPDGDGDDEDDDIWSDCPDLVEEADELEAAEGLNFKPCAKAASFPPTGSRLVTLRTGGGSLRVSVARQQCTVKEEPNDDILVPQKRNTPSSSSQPFIGKWGRAPAPVAPKHGCVAGFQTPGVKEELNAPSTLPSETKAALKAIGAGAAAVKDEDKPAKEWEVQRDRKRKALTVRDTGCKAICTIKRGLRQQDVQADESPFIPQDWGRDFEPVLGSYLQFLLSRPDQFKVIDGDEPGKYSIEIVATNETVMAPAWRDRWKAKEEVTQEEGGSSVDDKFAWDTQRVRETFAPQGPYLRPRVTAATVGKAFPAPRVGAGLVPRLPVPPAGPPPAWIQSQSTSSASQRSSWRPVRSDIHGREEGRCGGAFLARPSAARPSSAPHVLPPGRVGTSSVRCSAALNALPWRGLPEPSRPYRPAWLAQISKPLPPLRPVQGVPLGSERHNTQASQSAAPMSRASSSSPWMAEAEQRMDGMQEGEGVEEADALPFVVDGVSEADALPFVVDGETEAEALPFVIEGEPEAVSAPQPAITEESLDMGGAASIWSLLKR